MISDDAVTADWKLQGWRNAAPNFADKVFIGATSEAEQLSFEIPDQW